VLDARRCISYLTIENKEAIPIEFRKAIGNRIYGCDDCQFICPWNRFSHFSKEEDFSPRFNLDNIELTKLFLWTEKEFNKRLEGSSIRRIGYQAWLRNIAVALGNSTNKEESQKILLQKKNDGNLSEMVLEHIDWALKKLKP
jgi:epoxyqueuosine reductase